MADYSLKHKNLMRQDNFQAWLAQQPQILINEPSRNGLGRVDFKSS